MTSINETINAALPAAARSYQHEVGEVTVALTEREHALSDTITDEIVANFGVSRDEVRGRLEGIGMAVRPAPQPVSPEPVVEETPVAAEGKGKKDKKAKKDRLDKLEASVARLTELAERHLGARA